MSGYDYLDQLKSHARSRKLQKFLIAYKQYHLGDLFSTDMKARVRRLSSIPECGLDQDARRFAEKGGTPQWSQIQACPSSPGSACWQEQLNRYINEHDKDWRTVVSLLEHRHDEALSERRAFEERHNVILAHELDVKLNEQFHLSGLEGQKVFLAQAKAIGTEVRAVGQREAAAVEAVRKVWQGTQGVKRYSDRASVTLSEVDQRLAREWARNRLENDAESDFWVGAMESARCAELVALGIYHDIYGDVEDLSILQEVAPADRRWQIADVNAPGRWIDVKNARRSFSSPNSYSEHCVKRLKSDPCNRQVVISGFLSPYLTDGGQGTQELVIWLGETTLETIESLRSQFETCYLRIDLSSKWAIRIPPWLFEYPLECYAERDGALASVRSQGFILPRSDCPLGFLVLAGRVEESSGPDAMSEEALALSRRMVAGAVPTRPMLFLHVLDRFCRTARDGVPFPANALRKILFSGESHCLSKCSDETSPLAVCDPLETVKELLNVLEKVANRCAERAVAFTSFRLAGAGVFQGRCDGGNWKTIFAYCGGWRRHPNGVKNVKCGQNPLFMGQNEPCEVPTCGKLVCRTCGFCRTSCPACAPRQVGLPAS